ncbi:hypothetical protein MTsPCn9_02710 [Croceitalea sp. MTPC9]|uniref:DUF4331 family protein n=1 Tax=unclassified Croceitalea TaxID=2632280 RepID=UPI002B37E367|nr:hypothetical protein MTsPCn6_06000 [Croceitalea sp. MTPC6]GMN15335.1 hypothetical protein MTsPCn9_02710 [Croceitalea sp. MTPC9]
MKLYNIKYVFFSLALTLMVASCNNDDDQQMVDMATCDDGIMNGDETGVDCGGSCTPCETMSMDPDFSGTYAQVDHMGRPGINTVLGADDDTKDSHNVSIPSEQEVTFQEGYEARLEALHDAYAVALGADPADINYEPNILSDILGFDVTAEILTTVLSKDVLEVAPNAQTVYFDGNVPIGFTGRKLEDDVIDVSLILLFGGRDGARFNGEGGLPQLVTDGVGLTADNITTTFPYIGAPE